MTGCVDARPTACVVRRYQRTTQAAVRAPKGGEIALRHKHVAMRETAGKEREERKSEKWRHRRHGDWEHGGEKGERGKQSYNAWGNCAAEQAEKDMKEERRGRELIQAI